MPFSSGTYRRLNFGINYKNDRSESVPGKNSPENSENASENSIPQSKERKRKLCDVQPSKDDISASYPGGKAARIRLLESQLKR